MRSLALPLIVLTIFVSAVACSTQSSRTYDLSQAGPAPGLSQSGAIPVVWGLWDVSSIDGKTFISVPLRHSQFALNAVGELDSSPANLALNVIETTQGAGYIDVVVDINIKHPLTQTIYTGFDVCGLFMGNGDVPHPFDPTLLHGGPSDQRLLNPDGFTRWMNAPEFSGASPSLIGYKRGKKGSPGYTPTSTLIPYKYFCDGLGAESNAFDYLQSDPQGRGVFSVGSTNTRRYNLRFPNSTSLKFQYALLARWEPNINSPGPPVNIPDDFPAEANAVETVAIKVGNDISDMWFDGSSGGGSFAARVSVLNWNAVTEPSGEMSAYTIQLYSDAWTGGIVPDMFPDDSGANYYAYDVNIPAQPSKTGPLDVWIAISHPGATYSNPFGAPTGADGKTLAAHFLYQGDVTGEGLTWTPPTDHAPRFLFIHHSTGSGFLFDGGMWDKLTAAGFEVHDRTYGDGWVGDNTDPPHFPITFTEHYDDMISWELPPGEHYDIIAFKSCFPASDISSDQMLLDYQGYYNTIKTVTEAHPETLFIPFSTPPLTPASTSPENAARARQFADWLTDPYDDGQGNMVAYNLFDILAGSDSGSGDFNCLRYDFQNDPYDSHPNHLANTTVADNFTAWLTGVVW